ncbi:MAG: ferritin-like domain-containing protein [Planctomycetota bacterium]|jgi:hypothetical protein
MLLTREEMAHDFGEAKFELPRDKDLLAWIFSQFLYGELTGVQIGHWIRQAPDVESAKFLARQCIEELQHVDVFLELFKWLGARPVKVHPVVKFLSAESADWNEHCALEMAQGEGFVLMIFYGIIDCMPDEKLKHKLEMACRQEESHVEFGEQQTMAALKRNPRLRKRLLGLHILSLWAVKRFEKWLDKRIDKDHPVLKQLPGLLQSIISQTDTRLQRMGMTDKPLAEYSGISKFGAVVSAVTRKGLRKLRFWRWFKNRSLTRTYMGDPYLDEVMKLDEVKNAAGILAT